MLIKLKLLFNGSANPEIYKTDLEPEEFSEFLASGRKINFLVTDRDGSWHFSIVTFKSDIEGVQSIPDLFRKDGLFGNESNHSKNQLHAMLTSLAGTFYFKLGNDLQPVVSYAVDPTHNFYTASKNIPNFNSADILIDEDFFIDKNQLVNPSNNAKYRFKGLATANLLNSFLDNQDNNKGNWGVVLDDNKEIAKIVQIDTECCWGPNFFELNPDHVRYILEHPIQGTYPLQLKGTTGEEEIKYIESELAEVLRKELFPQKISKVQLQQFEKEFMDEAVETLFRIISTPNRTYRHMIDTNLNQPIATAYKDNFYNTLIKNKNMYAKEALKVKPYVEKARLITMEDTRWVKNIKLEKLHTQFCLEMCRHEVTGYSPLTLFKLTDKITGVKGASIKESYHLTTIKAKEYNQLINALKANYQKNILKILLPELEIRFKEMNKNSNQSADNNSSILTSNFFLSGNSHDSHSCLNKRPRQMYEFESLWNEYDFFNKEKRLERPLEQAQLDNSSLNPFEESIECDTPTMKPNSF